MDYRIVLTPDDNGTQLVSVPDFPEAHTFGVDVADARARAREAVETVIAAYMKDRRPIPKPRPTKKADLTVTLPALVTAKIDLYHALRDSRMTKYALAKALGWHVPQVDRLFDVRHASKLDQIEAAAAALGKRVEVRVA